ncbi:MAG: response regulator [Bacteroidota bacterium]
MKSKACSKSTILIVRKKSATQRDLTSLRFNDHLQFITAESGYEAIRLLRDHLETTLVLINADLPGMNGFDTTFQIRKISYEIPVILLANQGNTESVSLSKLYGCSRLLQSPVDPAELDRVVTGYLNQSGDYHDPACISLTNNETLNHTKTKKSLHPIVSALFRWAV